MRISRRINGFGLVALVSMAVLASAGSRAAADEPLRWKFTPGEKLDYNMTQDMTMSSEGGPVGAMEMKIHQVMDMTWDVQQVNEQGDAVMRQTFDRLTMKTTGTFGGFEFDSQSEEAPVGLAAMLAPMYKAMTESEFIVTMSPRGEVKDVKIPDEVVAAMQNIPGAAAMGDLATADGFKKMIAQGSLVLPEAPPQPGDEWSTTMEMAGPMGGAQSVESTYRYEGIRELDGTTYAVIRPDLKMEFGADPQQQQQMQMKITDQSSDGELLFDVDAGRLHSSTLNQKMTISVTVGDQSVEQKIDQKIDVKVTPAE